MNHFDTNSSPDVAGQGMEAQILGTATASDTLMSLPSPKIRPWHLQRKAIVYIRQSTPQQVLEHRESADRQYSLVHRAAALGWPQDGVEVVDEDQGRSGQTVEGRLGFQYLLAEISLDHVGIIFGLEMSRLARSNKDWHQLLELCAIFRTLLADQDGLYDPTDYNDRLLLGLKGTMSEAELHVLRSRMYQGLLNKARRGEVFNHPPAGYIKLPTGTFALDPDEQVQSVIRLLFDQFQRQGSIHGLLHYLVEHNIRMPIRPHYGPNRGQLEWRRPNRVTLQYLLHHPLYAGYYRWGHRPCDPRRKVGGRPGTGRTVRSPEECLVLLEGRCPAYITVERFWANQRRLEANRAASLKGVRHGPSLLGGLLVCGRCGRHLLVGYTNAGRGLRYSCVRGRIDYGEPLCQSLSGQRLDALVSAQVLSVLQPAALELHLSAAADVAQERRRLHQHWQQQLERVRYEAERAARQYQAVEPENRLVARELERRWEGALAEQSRLTEEYERFGRSQPASLSAVEQEQIRSLARDIPQLWHADTTTAAERQRLVRFLIEQIEVSVQGETDQVEVAIRWAGGFVSRHSLARAVQSYEQLADYRRLRARIAELRAAGKSMAAVAESLNEEGFRPPKRARRFSKDMVGGFLAKGGRSGPRPVALSARGLLRKGEWLLTDLARHLGMPSATLHRWRKVGWVHARKLPVGGGHWALWADAAELKRLVRLRGHQRPRRDQPIPSELTTPKKRKQK
ncbi:MAG TPA: recombinase family protein [Gemmataceae bacterium]|nr:recombinase family protein [Gemmataceae bacterium]